MRTILDCERDLKGLHKWQMLGDSMTAPGTYLYWCRECGAVGDGTRPDPKVIKRVQEKENDIPPWCSEG